MKYLKHFYMQIKSDFKKKLFFIFLILVCIEGIFVSFTSLWVVNKTLMFNHISEEIIQNILFKISIAKFAMFAFSFIILVLTLNFLILKRINPELRLKKSVEK